MIADRMTTTLLIVVLLSMSSAGLAAAEESEDDHGDITERQRALNERGVDAIEAGEYDEAIELYEASLQLGELNIIHANLGRALQLAGDCESAEVQYDKALDAQPVEQPPPELIEDTIANYRDELAEKCPGFLEVDCKPEAMALFIDDDGPGDCDSDPRELMPGLYELRGEYREHSVDTTVEIEGLQTTTTRLHIDEPGEQLTPPEDVAPVADDGISDWVWLAGSGAAIAGGVALDTIPQQARNYEVNAINFVPVGLYAAAAGLAFMGVSGMIGD